MTNDLQKHNLDQIDHVLCNRSKCEGLEFYSCESSDHATEEAISGRVAMNNPGREYMRG